MYNRHNSGGQLLKTRQNEMFLTARLFRPDEPIQSKQLRNQAGYLTDSRRFRPRDAELETSQIFTKNLQLETSDLYYTPVWLCEPDSNQQPLDKIAVSVLGLRQRLNIDFKGPLPSVSSNGDVLTVCEVTSRTTAYKSSRKGTRKGYHGVIWKAITLTQWFQQLPIEQWEEAFDLTITFDTFINVGSNQHSSPSLGIPHFSCSLFSEEHRRVHSSQSGKFTRPKCTQQIQTEKSMEYAMPIRGQIYLQWRSLKERKLTERITSGM
ncbi:hypothetical protein T06_9972 [Trichinella sp. T6]|nr:hypothetical protein T06_9972 [Trichinella sp. T6]